MRGASERVSCARDDRSGYQGGTVRNRDMCIIIVVCICACAYACGCVRVNV